MAIADFNGDGRNDIAALDSYGPQIFECAQPPGPIDCGGDRMLLTVLLNEGMAHFAPIETIPAMCAPWTMAAGDFNGDGHADVMIGNRGARDAFGICFQASVSLYPGDGTGGFGVPQHLTVPYEPTDSAVGDFNGDGVLDVVMLFGEAGRVQIFRTTLAGTFVAGPPFGGGTLLNGIAAGDLDGDFRDEFAVGFQTLPRVAIFEESGPGSIVQVETAMFAFLPYAPRSLVIADFTLDGVPDIAANRPGSGEVVTLLTQDANGSYGDWQHQISSPMAYAFNGRLATADVNFDGIPDLAATDGAWHFQTLVGDGTGHFTASPLVATSGATESIVAGDLNGDLIDDLVTGGSPVYLLTGSILTLVNETQVTDVMAVSVEGDDLDWYGVFGATGYDLVRGDLRLLQSSGGDYSAATEACVGSGIVWSDFVLPDDPPPGAAWWILGRPRFAGGAGSYDEWGSSQAGPRDPGINASPNACP